MPANLSVQDVDDEVIDRLNRRAARHGQSVEAELRDILRQALEHEPDGDFGTMAAEVRRMSAGRTHTPAELLQREGRAER